MMKRIRSAGAAIASVARHLRHGDWEVGIGLWKGSAKVFACGRDWYDGWWYGFRLGPFWAACNY